MRTITIIGFDIAKSVFQGVDSAGGVVIRRQLKSRYVLTRAHSSISESEWIPMRSEC